MTLWVGWACTLCGLCSEYHNLILSSLASREAMDAMSQNLLGLTKGTITMPGNLCAMARCLLNLAKWSIKSVSPATEQEPSLHCNLHLEGLCCLLHSPGPDWSPRH